MAKGVGSLTRQRMEGREPKREDGAWAGRDRGRFWGSRGLLNIGLVYCKREFALCLTGFMP